MKLKFKGVTKVRKNFTTKESWLRIKKKKKDLKCENCGRFHEEMPGDIGVIAAPGMLNKHVCNECCDAYIFAGADDIEAKINQNKTRKSELIEGISATGYKVGYYGKKLEDRSIEDLEKLYAEQKAIKTEKDRIEAMVISEEDAFMEPYLKDDHGVIQDTKYLKCEEQIECYFKEDYHDLFDCGQGYFQDTAKVIIKIAKKFYEVTITAEIGSAKQDVGDRLYWPESIEKVEWNEIPKPEPKEYQTYDYSFSLNPDQKTGFDSLLRDNGFKPLDKSVKKE